MTPKERLDWYRGEQEKRKLQAADGQFVPAADFEQELANLVKAMVNWSETLPDVLERDAGLAAPQVERVQVLVDQQRARLHQDLVKATAKVDSADVPV